MFLGGVGHECSSLSVIVIGLVSVFSLWCVGWVGSLRAGRVFVCFCVGGGVGARGGVGWLWGCFEPPGDLLCWPFWGGGPGVGLALCCFVVCSAGRFVFVLCLALCRFVLVFSVLLALRLPRFWGVGRGGGAGRGALAGLGAFRAFVRFVLGWVCRFPLPLGVWEVLRFVALPGLFSYLFFS